MTTFRQMYGAVYVLENLKAQRVKVGMTINSVAVRLNDANDKWAERKGTCQICGGRLVLAGGRIPKHVLSGINCDGGNYLPLESDVSLSEAFVEALRLQQKALSGSEKNSVSRKIKTLERRICQYRNHRRHTGSWRIHTVYYTECAEQVELLSHELLGEFLDVSAPFGEVFSCPVSVATDAIEIVLNRLGLLKSARKISE